MVIFKNAATMLIKLLLLSTVVATTYLLLFFYSYDYEKYNYSYYPALLNKISLIKNTPSPKIIFVGGSNIVYGLDSDLISRKTGLPVINMGLTAALGLKFMLDQVKPYLKRNDLVVIVPEYHHFVGNFLCGNNELLLASEILGDYSMALTHPAPEIIYYLLEQNKRIQGYIFTIAIKCLPKAIEKSLLVITDNPSSPLTQYNSHGDIILHDNEKKQKHIDSYPIDGKINNASIKYLADFSSDNKTKNITTLFMFPALQKKYYMIHKDIIQKIACAIKNAGITIISSPEDFLYDDGDMYDTIYHLDEKGKKIRTDMVLVKLNNFTHNSIPARP